MTKWSFEVPHKHLNDFRPYQDFHFCLSKGVRETSSYREYLEQVSNEGLSTLWLDNNYNETFCADSPQSLVYTFLSENIRFQKVISPDDPKWTTGMIFNTYCEMKNLIPESSLICVVSSLNMYHQLKNMIGHPPATVAVSYWTRRDWKRDDLITIRNETNLHFLGSLDPIEIERVQPNSCDTSMPVKLALKGWDTRKWASNGYPHIHTADLGLHGRDFFNTEMAPEQLHLAFNNVETFKTFGR